MSLPNGFTDTSSSALPLHVLERDRFSDWRNGLPPALQAWVDAQQFSAAPGALLLLPGEHGIAAAAIGIGDPLDPYSYAHAPLGLPPGDWRLASALESDARAALQLGWGLGSYRFDRYRKPARQPARLLLQDADAEALDLLAACVRVRDLVNTPTEHMGPEQLEAVARELAQAHGAQLEVIVGDELLARNFPAIHAVGRASHRAPRLIALRWGDSGLPHVTLVGKGVCFDTGGLDIKPADGMRNMKKDMGGAAHVLALGRMIMAAKLPVRLAILIPVVENAISGDA
ncbi:MAG: leucyl aminopeptidase family protein, partial [Pseudoxanthomonas sp.]